MKNSTSSKKPNSKLHAVIIGGGVIGASWAALFLANGLRVTICDPDPEIEPKVRAVFESAEGALEGLGFDTKDMYSNLDYVSDVAKAVTSADIVQECGPEKAGFKQSLWKTIEAAAPADALLLSSSSGIPASVQATEMQNPGRLIIGHPFNPPHLMPLVEIVPTTATSPDLTARAVEFYEALGKVAIVIRKEIPGFVANRLQAAIFQECLHLVKLGVVTLEELDRIVMESLGIRWATCGPFLSFHLGGGAGGLKHFIEHLGPGMEQLWKTIGGVSFDEETNKLLLAQIRDSYGTQSYSALSEQRDAKEVAVINGLAQVSSASD